jgi:hypothetical protein
MKGTPCEELPGLRLAGFKAIYDKKAFRQERTPQ